MACDITGALPTKDSQYKSGDVVTISKTTVMRCAQFKDGAHPSDPIMRTYIIGRLPDLPIVSIAVDPVRMFDRTQGLYDTTECVRQKPCYTANYWKDDELPVQIEFFERGMGRLGWSHRAGLRMFGGYSRANKKKSVVITFRDVYGQGRLNYRLFPDYPELTRFKHFVLRNNGNNFDLDYIRDMLMTQLTDGMGVDYQKGRAVIVYYNGEYFGIHNLRERGNGDYFDTNYGISEDDIDLVKAGGEVSRGSDADYQSILRWLGSLNGMTDDNIRELGERLDIDNFLYQHIARIYYHDRDWPGNNMKRWRSVSRSPKWKFLMYDTDHGWGSHGMTDVESDRVRLFPSSIDYATAERGLMWPNPPASTLILRKLLQNENGKRKFINMFSLMMAAYFSNDRVDAKINALMSPIQNEIEHDQARWGHDVSKFDEHLRIIRNFNRDRTPQMYDEIKTFFNLSDPVDVTLETEGNGKIYVDGMEMPGARAALKGWREIPITLTAAGSSFHSWSDGVTDRERTVTPDRAMTLTAHFSSSSILDRSARYDNM